MFDVFPRESRCDISSRGLSGNSRTRIKKLLRAALQTLAELLGFDHKLAVHAELLGCVLQRLFVLSLTCPLAWALGLCITETHPRTSCQPYGEHAVGCRKAPLCTHLGPIWASATGAAETFSFSDLRSTASGALEKRWRSCSSRKTTSKDVRCTPTRWAASFFSLAACPELLLRR